MVRFPITNAVILHSIKIYHLLLHILSILPCHRTAWLRVSATSWGVSEPWCSILPALRCCLLLHLTAETITTILKNCPTWEIAKTIWFILSATLKLQLEFMAIELEEQVPIVQPHVQHAGYKSCTTHRSETPSTWRQSNHGNHSASRANFVFFCRVYFGLRLFEFGSISAVSTFIFFVLVTISMFLSEHVF